MNLLIGKNGIDWDAMGFTVYGECPPYGSTRRKRNNVGRNSKENISHTPQYRLWARLLQIDRGNVKGQRGTLCEEWKVFANFKKWYDENYYVVDDNETQFTYKFFDCDNTMISPQKSCFLPRKIMHKKVKDNQFVELIDKYKNAMPDNVKIYCEKLCKEVANGKVE